MIKAIPTRYNGIFYRSRLEGRWAIFFNILGINTLYEYEGYDLDGINYLPDFYLPDLDCYVEIKGLKPSREEQYKAYKLSELSHKVVHIFSGSVPNPGIETWNDCRFETFTFDYKNKENNLRGQMYLKDIYALNRCPVCQEFGFSVRGLTSKLPCGCVKRGSTKLDKLVAKAYKAARSARFEYL
jgi:hypothetical protein